MITEYLGIIIAAMIIIAFMYISHLKDTNKDLQRQKQNLQTKIIQEQAHTNIKEFQAYQKAKKEEIKKHLKDKDEKRNINLNVGSHTISF